MLARLAWLLKALWVVVMSQPTLFDLEPTYVDEIDPIQQVAQIAVVYTCAQSAKTSHVRMFMSIEDAMSLCSDSSTQGKVHGSQWITMWTTLDRLLSVLGDNPQILVEDDGRFLPLCEHLGVLPIPATDHRVSKWVKR